MTARWKPGDRVRNMPEYADLYSEKMGAEKMSKPRGGTVVKVPLATLTSADGEGTLLIEWDSLTGAKLRREDWQTWEHSGLLELEGQMTAPECRKCCVEMEPGQALLQTFVGGMLDFPGDPGPVTLSAGGPGKLVSCWKCPKCGRSVSQ